MTRDEMIAAYQAAHPPYSTEDTTELAIDEALLDLIAEGKASYDPDSDTLTLIEQPI